MRRTELPTARAGDMMSAEDWNSAMDALASAHLLARKSRFMYAMSAILTILNIVFGLWTQGAPWL